MTTPSDDYIYQIAAPASAAPEGSGIRFAARTSGLYRSHDGGGTWESAYASLRPREPLTTTSIALAPDFDHEPTIFAGLNGAILRSYDGGTSWQRGQLPNPPPAVSALAVSPDYAEDGIVFAGTNEDGVMMSKDRGRSWAAWNFGLLDLTILCLAISPAFSADETIFAGVESGLFRSTNGGRAWREVALPGGFDAVLSLAVSPAFARDGTLFAGTEGHGLLVCHDRGKSWRPLARALRRQPVNQILLSPSAPERDLLILHGGTPLASKDGGKTWEAWRVKPLAGRTVTALLAPVDPGSKYLAGFEDGRIGKV